MEKTRRRTTLRVAAAGGAMIATLAGAVLTAAPAQALYNQKDAVAGQFPFYVNLGGCGGTLVDPEWVLTAAHCASDAIVGNTIDAGWTSYWEPGTPTTVRETHRSSFSDIALLRVDRVTSVKPIDISLGFVRNGDPLTSVAAGGGSNGRLGSADFRVTDEPGALNTGGSPTNFTMVGVEAGTWSCGGDSGSPIVTNTAKGPRLTGVTFAINGTCTTPGQSTYATSLQTPLVIDWLHTTMGKRLGQYQIRNKNSGKVLDVNSAGEIVQRERNATSASQTWTFNKDSGTTPRPATEPANVSNTASGQLLGVIGGWQNNGANAVQFPDVDAPDQSWSFTLGTDGYFTIVNNNSGKVLDIPGGSTADGEKAVQWDSNGGDNQKWTLIRVN